MIHLANQSTDTSWLDGVWGTGATVIAIVVAGVVLYYVIARIISRTVKRWIASGRSRENSLVDNPEETVELQAMIMSQRREQRARAVGQLLRNTIAVFITGTAILLVLTELGVNITPLLASAGVIGIALGVGAQTLVKDYLSGFFMIVEDQYGVGDLVDVGPVVGTVEEVTLRITRIRDPSGVVWYVRNGEILRVANQSQGWTMAAAVIPVSYDADLEQIRQIVAQVGNDMYNDPEAHRMMLSRPSFAGVDAVSGEAVYIRVIAKARGGQQVTVTRELRERLKGAFDRNGVIVPVLARPVSYGQDGLPIPPGSTSPGTPAR